MILTHKTECFPNEEQKQFFEKCFGCRRFFFNVAINELKKRYNHDLKGNIKNIKTKEIMSLRKDVILSKYRDIKLQVPDQILYTSMEDVVFAIDSLRKKGKDIKYRKKKNSNTFRICRSGSGTTFWYENGSKEIILPQFNKYKLPSLKLAEAIRWEVLPETIRTCTIKKFAGRYWISFTCEVKDNDVSINHNRHLGIDWGISTYLTCFDGKNIHEFDFDKEKLEKLDYRLRKNQKSLSRKALNSKNYDKAKTKLQQSYLNLNNYRHSVIDDIISFISKNYDSVTLETLDAKFFSKNKRLSRMAALKPPYLFKIRLINKLNQYGKKVYQVPKTFASTQICNCCGNQKQGNDKLKLGEKVYKCSICGNTDHRDHNAAKNLYSFKNLEESSLD